MQALHLGAADRLAFAGRMAERASHLLLTGRVILASANLTASYVQAEHEAGAKRDADEARRRRLQQLLEAAASECDGMTAAGSPIAALGSEELAAGATAAALRLKAVLSAVKAGAELSVEEKRSILEALGVRGSAGWTGSGHVFRCPNGHVYVIGDVSLERCSYLGSLLPVFISGTAHSRRPPFLRSAAAPCSARAARAAGQQSEGRTTVSSTATSKRPGGTSRTPRQTRIIIRTAACTCEG